MNAALCPLPSELGNFCPRQLAQWRSSQYLPFRPSIGQSRLHSFCDQRPLGLGNGSSFEIQFNPLQRGIDPFSHRDKIDSEGTATSRVPT